MIEDSRAPDPQEDPGTSDLRLIVWARLDKERNALVMTRRSVYDARSMITLAPITSTIRGLASEVRVGRRNGIHHESVALLDNVQTLAKADILRHVGYLWLDQEEELAVAVEYAYSLTPPTP
jgi:mRNA interferase MazF